MKSNPQLHFLQVALTWLLVALMAEPNHRVLGQSDGLYLHALEILINDGAPQRSTITNVSVRFNTNVIGLTASNLFLHNLSSNAVISPTNFTFRYDGTNTATWAFTNLPGHSLPDGNYLASLLANGLSGPNGEALDGNRDGRPGDAFIHRDTLHNFRHSGDWNGDRDVDFWDNYWFQRAFGHSTPSALYNPIFDFNADGIINAADKTAFNDHYFTVLPRQPALFAALVRDTGDSWDTVTEDATIAGAVLGTNTATRFDAALRRRVDAAGSFTDKSESLTADGSFWFTPEILAQLLGSPLTDGDYTLDLRTRETDGTITARFAVPFTLIGATNCPLASSDGWIITASFPSTLNPQPVSGGVQFTNCEMVLTEGDSFLVAAERTVTIPPMTGDPRLLILQINYQAPAFDSTATNLMRDAFEIVLVDAAGRPLTYTIQGSNSVTPASVANPSVLPASPDALFNHTDGRAPFAAPGIALSALNPQLSTVAVDISHLPPNSAARLILRLVNNDRDRATAIRINDVSFRPRDPNLNLIGSPPTALSLLSAATTAEASAIGSITPCPPGLPDFRSGNTLTTAVVSTNIPIGPAQTTNGDSVLPPDGRIAFTTTEEFQRGTLFNVGAMVFADELRLNSNFVSYPFIWIPNHGEGTASKFDTRTGQELGRYRTGPENLATRLQPSRTAVDADGNVWVANRMPDVTDRPATAVKVLQIDFIDRNGNGIADTSEDRNGNGRIDPTEILPWDANGDGQPDDERIAISIQVGRNRTAPYTPSNNGFARAAAVDEDNNIWIGLWNLNQFEVYRSLDGALLSILPTDGHGRPYGAVADKAGRLWGSGREPNRIQRIDTRSRTLVESIPTDNSYGITVDPDGAVWQSQYESQVLLRFDPATRAINRYGVPSGESQLRGVAVDRNRNVWVASTTHDRLIKYIFDATHTNLLNRITVPVGDMPAAAVLDTDGFIWTTTIADNRAWKIDPTNNVVITNLVTGEVPYAYSDLTGQVLANTVQRGTWSEIVDAGRPDTVWGTVVLDASSPAGTSLRVQVRASDVRSALGSRPEIEIVPGEVLPDIRGQFLEVKVTLNTDLDNASPVVRSVTVLSVPPPTLTVEAGGRNFVPGATVLLTGLAQPARPELPDGSLVANAITYVTLNGAAVTALDAAGNFFNTVEIRPGQNSFVVLAEDLFGQTVTNTLTIQGVCPDNTSRLEVVSASVQPEYGRTSFNEWTKVLYADLALRNTGTYPIRAPFYVGVTRISDPSVHLLSPDGMSADGIPYYDFTATITNTAACASPSPGGEGRGEGGILCAGQTSLNRTLAFSNPNHVQFTYDLLVLGQLNQAPSFTTVPPLEVITNRVYSYDAEALDPDGDTLRYSLLESPRGMTLDPTNGFIRWTATNALGTYRIRLQADDQRGGLAEQTYLLSVIAPPSNRPPYFVSTPVTVARVSTNVTSEPQILDLSRWSVVQIPDGFQPPGNWVFSQSNTVADQTVNADPSLLVTDFDLVNDQISGTWRTSDTGDDDFMGFAFGYQDPQHFYLFDWKRGDQNHRGYAERGMSVKVASANSALNGNDLWPSAGSPGRVRTIFHNTIPWQHNIDYTFTLAFRPGEFTITVQQGTNVLATIELTDDTYASGRFAFYNYSQGQVRYTGFTRRALPSPTYVYDADAHDPDSDPLTYSFIAAPTNMTINPLTGVIRWGPTAEQIGTHDVAVQVRDGRGGTNVQSYRICVLPAEGNHPPLFVSTPPAQCLSTQVQGVTVDVLVPYLSIDYRYLIVANGGVPGFERLDFDDSAFSIGAAGFGSGSCDLNDIQFTRTTWPANTDLLIRRILPLSDRVTGLRIKVALDNDIEVFVNGQDVSNGRQYHDGCPTRDSLVFVVPPSLLVPGNNLIAIRAIDRGVFAYFDMEVIREEAPASLRYLAKAIDPDGDAVRYVLGAAPVGISLNPNTGALIWPTNQLATGDYSIELFAEDGKGGRARQAFTLHADASCLPSIRGVAWHDLNTNGVRDAASLTIEPGLGGRIIYADSNDNDQRDVGEPFALSSSTGLFEFGTLAPGNHRLRLETVRGWSQWFPAASDALSVAVVAGQTAGVLGFGLVQVPLGSRNASPIFLSTPNTTVRVGESNLYSAFARDLDGDSFTFDLVVHPEGMLVETNSGVVAWRPLLSQLGVHDVILRVQDGRGGVALQSWPITVIAPNSPPIITTFPPGSAVLGLPYRYLVRAQDAEGQSLTFLLASNAPGGLTLTNVSPSGEGGQSAILQWTPALADLGTNKVEIIIHDSEGAESRQTFSLEVVASAPNRAPQFITAPRTQTRLDSLYGYLAGATDPDGDPVTLTLVEGPSGMILTNGSPSPQPSPLGEGVLLWTPDAAQLGSNFVHLRVTDGRTGTNDQRFAIHVSSTLSNQAPLIVSTPSLHATAGQPYEYDLAASDPDGDPVTWRLVQAPVGVSLDPASGALRWNPTLDQLGTNIVIVEAQDSLRATDVQTWSIDVSCLNRPPQITSVPPTQAQTSDPYLYALRAQDPDGDAVMFSFANTNEIPAGMTLSNLTATAGGSGIGGALLRWTPTTNQVGAYVIRLRVSDGRGGSDSQTYHLYAADLRANKAPLIVSTPARGATIGRPYTYTLRATDADGDTLTFQSLAALPNGATLNPQSSPLNSAMLSWIPTLAQQGQQEFILSARDPADASAAQRFFVTVRTNEAPRIVSTPRTNAVPDVAYRYDMSAFDPDGDALTYAFTSPVPSGMSIDSLGRIVWLPSQTQIDLFPVTVGVSDGFGGTTSQSFAITVTADNEPPLIALTMLRGATNSTGQWAGNLGDIIRVRVDASDNVGVASRAFYRGTNAIQLDASHTASILVDRGGVFNFTGVAADFSGNSNSTSRTILFRDPSATNHVFVQIHTPMNESIITQLVDVVATITNESDIVSYSWGYALVSDVNLNGVNISDPAFTLLGSSNLPPGIRSITNFVVGRFDPTILNNDSYVIAVAASDANGNVWTEPVVVNVQGNLKFGEFRLEFTDLAIPVAGIPITVTRVYDSRLSKQRGDFGFGWQLGIKDAQIREVLGPDGSLRPQAHVYLNGPDGRRLGFTFTPASFSGFLVGTFHRPFFTADPGVFDRLEVPGGDFSYPESGLLSSIIAEFSGPYDPSTYFLTTRDGTRYEYDQQRGLQNVNDSSGNRLIYTRDGIFHYNAGGTAPDQSVRFIRDPQGRITQIIDPNGVSVRYAYDALGDLRSFSDQVTNTTRYAYSASRAHFLTNIVDPLGRSALSIEYDSTGRLKTVRDANGNPISQDFDVDSKSATFSDGNGTVIHTRFDDNGNEIVRRIDGVSTNYLTYDANNNLLASTNGRGFSTNYTYDARGNVTSITDSLSNRTSIAYNAQNKPVQVVNALGQTLNLHYDSAGRLLEVINNAGLKTIVTRDGQGRVASLTDSTGTNTTIFDYSNGCACGKPGKVINPDGSFKLTEYDSLGNTTRTVNELGAETLSLYDANGKLLWTRDPLTNYTQFFYNGPLLTNVVDGLGRPTFYEYDSLNRTNKIIDAENGVIEFRYDNNGNRTHVIDAVTNVTTFVYDSANRLKMQIDPLGHTNLFGFDAAGNRTEAIDRNGRKRTFLYDAANRMTNELWWEGTNVVRSIVFGFNELGVQTLAADPAARYDYAFDALNRLERVAQSAVSGQPDFSLAYTYTALGQVESVTDNYGVRVGSGYDNRNRLSRRTWQGPGVDPARVDFQFDVTGNRTRTDRFADLAGANRIGFTTNAYNRAGIVTNITHRGPASQVLGKYDYDFDAAYQITRWAIGNQLSDFAYDRTGQLTNALNTAQPNENFRFDANGNRVGAQSSGQYVVGGNNQILSDGTNGYAYEAEGNMTSRSNTVTGVLTTYQFDHRNRLVSVLDRSPGGVVTQAVAFVYDAMNRRLSKTVSGPQNTNVVRFLYNQDDSWADLDGTNAITARYLHGARIDELLARQRARDGRGWYLTDHLGTVRDIANATGAVVAHVDYSSFGQVLGVSNPSVVDRFLFTGREWDDETGLYCYRSRYYSPMLGRFVSKDGACFAGNDANLYRYGNNYPLGGTDPSGNTFVEASIQSRIPLLVQRAVLAVAAATLCVITAIATELSAAPGFEFPAGFRGILFSACAKRCLPCNPSVGSIAYRVDYPPSPPHNGIPTPHSHEYQMHQSPPSAGCRCFWVETRKDPFPGVRTPFIRPASGGGVAP